MSEVLNQHSRMPRKYLADGTPQPRDGENGRFLPVPDDKKKLILAGLRDALLNGETLESYATKSQVALRTLEYWCAQMPEEYRDIRKQWVDAKIVEARHMMMDASDPFELAKGREIHRAAFQYAQVRDDRYAEKKEVTMKGDEPTTPEAIRDRISLLEKRLGVRTINQEQENQDEPPAHAVASSA